MERRIWLMATVVALFGLQAPLCAVACLEIPARAAAAAHAAEPPCHEESPEPSPADAPMSHGDCGGCELSAEALLPGSDARSNVVTLALVSPSAFSEAVDPGVHFAPAVPEVSDLPPPDILRLKSTLLI